MKKKIFGAGALGCAFTLGGLALTLGFWLALIYGGVWVLRHFGIL